MSIARSDTEFKKTHEKLFNREINVKKKSIKTDISKMSLFEKFREDYSDPFEKARESKATQGQIQIINMAMFACGLFGLLLSISAYSYEYYEDYNMRLYVILCMIMFSSIFEVVFHLVKLNLRVN